MLESCQIPIDRERETSQVDALGIENDGGRENAASEEIWNHIQATSTEVSKQRSRELAHVSMTGRRHVRDDRRALKSSWTTRAFSNPQQAPWSLDVAPAKVLELLNGSTPLDWEDGLFIHADGPDAEGNLELHFHSARSGAEQVRLELRIVGELAAEAETWKTNVTTIWWETDDKVRVILWSGLEMAKFVALEACHWVMGVDLDDEIEEPEDWPCVSYVRGDIPASTSVGPTKLYRPGVLNVSRDEAKLKAAKTGTPVRFT